MLFEFTGLVGETQEVIGGDIIILSEGLDMVAGDISHTALVGAVILICRVEYVGDFFLRFFRYPLLCHEVFDNSIFA